MLNDTNKNKKNTFYVIKILFFWTDDAKFILGIQYIF